MTPELLAQGLLFCPSCARNCLAEMPPCSDGHGDACPDRACVECGTAVVVGLSDATLVELAVGRAPRAGRTAA